MVKQEKCKEGKSKLKCSMDGEEYWGQWRGELGGLMVEEAREVAQSQVMKVWTCLAKSMNLTLHGMELLKHLNQWGILIHELHIMWQLYSSLARILAVFLSSQKVGVLGFSISYFGVRGYLERKSWLFVSSLTIWRAYFGKIVKE